MKLPNKTPEREKLERDFKRLVRVKVKKIGGHWYTTIFINGGSTEQRSWGTWHDAFAYAVWFTWL